MRWIVGWALAALVLWPMGAAAQDGACEPYSAVPVTVTPVFDEARYDNATALNDLQALARDPAHAIPHYEAVVLGLTRYVPLFEFRAPMMRQAMPDGSFCARAVTLEARIGYRDVTVYVAKEFPQGGCDYAHVLAHEEKHVAVNRALLQEYVPLMQQRLADYLKLYGMYIVPDPAYAEKTLRDKVDAIIAEMVGQMAAENARRQRLVDSPQEYATNTVACQGHVAEVARRFWVTGR